jgi:hypothetical protein
MGYKERINMTIKQMINQANKVYAWVNIHEEDGAYIQVVKSNLIAVLEKYEPSDHKFCPRDGDLYID